MRIKKFRAPVADVPAPIAFPPATPDAYDEVFVAFDENGLRWQALVAWGDSAQPSFRAEVVWESAGVAAIGGGRTVYFAELATGALRRELALEDFFGGLAVDEGDDGARPNSLYVCGYSDLLAIEPSLDVRWRLRQLAVDGILFHDTSGTQLHVDIELDPPGGWFEVTLDARTGAELSRKPAFSDDYVGLYSPSR
jgi:hypothetical protein